MWITFKSQPGLYFALIFSPVAKKFPSKALEGNSAFIHIDS
ncbi:hypothetical protein C943_00899 [Mariniradius saccharolyticus AK6]|uniref:Uncharacterized protein n=1 Tax=Mariniradius saccharolyticus AK6 TaxID=1239962 RepID=M7XWM8_9BACT|nr:hypothetical protein C943_00899 [Mariniradius saccharolyticus AK6]